MHSSPRSTPYGALILLAALTALAVTAPAPRPASVLPRVTALGRISPPASRQAIAQLREQRVEAEREGEAQKEQAGRGRSDASPERNASEARREFLGAAAQAVDARAYPRSYVDATRAQAARTAYATAPRRLAANLFRQGPQDSAPSLASSWTEVGPTSPIVPADVSFSGSESLTGGRVTALAVDPNCGKSGNGCRLWAAAAGGGIWRTADALAATVVWEPVQVGLTSAAFGSLLVDPTDPTGDTLYAGSGESSGSGDSEAGVGLFKSTNGGTSWTLVPGSAVVARDRAVGAIAVDPTNGQTIWIGTALARHGSGATGGRLTPPGAPPLGVYRSTDGGASFSKVFSRPGSPAPPEQGGDWLQGGVHELVLDPADPTDVYAGIFGNGIWRARDGNAAAPLFEQVFATAHPGDTTGSRSQFALAADGANLRMYTGDAGDDPPGPNLSPPSALWRATNVRRPASELASGGTNQPAWSAISSANPSSPGFTAHNYCQSQCSYDDVVAADPNDRETLVLGGSFDYSALSGTSLSNGRAVVRSTNAGAPGPTFSDMTNDNQDRCPGSNASPNFEPACPTALHPDTHAIAFAPYNPANLSDPRRGIVFVGSDGGVSRSGPTYADRSAECTTGIGGKTGRDLTGTDQTACEAFLRSVPATTTLMNDGFATLQFQSVSVSAANPSGDVLAGSQDNGTWGMSPSNASILFEGIGGDGGQSAIVPDAPQGDAGIGAHVHSYFESNMDVNYGSTRSPAQPAFTYNGVLGANHPDTWLYISQPFESDPNPAPGDPPPEGVAFYEPLISDPQRPGTLFVGRERVWRTTDLGGDRRTLEAHCQDSFYAQPDGVATCGDWQPLGATKLSGRNRANVVATIARAPSDQTTLWAGTAHGDLWISQNASVSPASVAFTKLSAPNAPGRFISGIVVDPANPLHAWISYSGYSAYTPGTPGHVFEASVSGGALTLNPLEGTDAGTLDDIPVTALQRDDASGDLYAATDFGVLRRPAGASGWAKAAPALPVVAVYGLTVAQGGRLLYAATHGRGLWKLTLPGAVSTPVATPPQPTSLGTPVLTPPPVRKKARVRKAVLSRRGRVVTARLTLAPDADGSITLRIYDPRRSRTVARRTIKAKAGATLTVRVRLRGRIPKRLRASIRVRNDVGATLPFSRPIKVTKRAKRRR